MQQPRVGDSAQRNPRLRGHEAHLQGLDFLPRHIDGGHHLRKPSRAPVKSSLLRRPLLLPCMNILGFARCRDWREESTAHMYPACWWASALALMGYPRAESSLLRRPLLLPKAPTGFPRTGSTISTISRHLAIVGRENPPCRYYRCKTAATGPALDDSARPGP